MSEQLLTVLKFCLLALVYLFLFRVVRAVWAEITPPRPVPAGGPGAGRGAPAAAGRPARSGRRGEPSLVVLAPPEQAGRRYVLGRELSVGRAAGCGVVVDDTFVSQLHARIYEQGGSYFVEDLGSTNGTFLNGAKVVGTMTLRAGDRLAVGNTVMELA